MLVTSRVDIEQIIPPADAQQGRCQPEGPLTESKPASRRAELEIKPPSGSSPVIRDLERRRVCLIWLFQFAVLLAMIGVFGRFGASAWTWVSGSTAFIGICALVGWKMWVATENADPLDPRSLLLWLMNAGIWLTTLGTVAVAWAIFIRINWRRSPLAALIFCGLLVVLAVLTWGLSRYAVHHQTTPWFQFAVCTFVVCLVVSDHCLTVQPEASRASILKSVGPSPKDRVYEADVME
jgi:hypothetical protein